MALWLAAGSVAYATTVGCLFLFQRSFLYMPDSARPEPAEWHLPEMTPITVNTDDGIELLAWHCPPRQPEQATILYFHGNAGHIGMRASRIRPYLEAGYGVLLLEYRGYGGNPGRPSEDGLYRDAGAALAFLDQLGLERRQVVLYGESLGTGVAVWLASQETVGGLILESPYTSLPDVAQAHFPFFPVSMLMLDRFDSYSRIKSIQAPLLVMHGAHDGIVPVRYGRTLFEAATTPKTGFFPARASHHDLYDYGAINVALNFLESLS